jgi:hypothetical protein
VMQARTAVGMTAGTDFEIKRTIHLVFFGAVNAGQVFGHCLLFLSMYLKLVVAVVIINGVSEYTEIALATRLEMRWCCRCCAS